MDNETHRNIVKWLLANPAFNQEDARGKFYSEKYSVNTPKGNAFHLAFAAQVPRDKYFYSENHGGNFGKTYVAEGALDAMLSHESFARAHINSCNEDGHSVLEYALEMAMERFSKMGRICFLTRAGVQSFDECIDISISTYAEDYTLNIQKLLECKHLRLHSTFGVVMISNEEGNYLMPQQLVRRDRTSILNSAPTKGMEVFRKICTTRYVRTGETAINPWGEMRDKIVNAILSNNVGQLPDGVKAQSMSICISSQSRLIFNPEWVFNPSKLTDKKVGAIARKFFVKNANSALYAVQRYTSIIHREYDEILLCNVRDALFERHSLSSKLWKNILAYAGYRNENNSRLTRLSGLNDTIQNTVLPFFYGGIQSCIDRKLEEHVPADAWNLIFQFAGLRRSFPKNLDEILGPLVRFYVCGHCKKRKEKLLFCNRCKRIKYCGRDCQRDDWPIHKKMCKGRQ